MDLKKFFPRTVESERFRLRFSASTSPRRVVSVHLQALPVQCAAERYFAAVHGKRPRRLSLLSFNWLKSGFPLESFRLEDIPLKLVLSQPTHKMGTS